MVLPELFSWLDYGHHAGHHLINIPSSLYWTTDVEDMLQAG
jgi:hypothetical protein